MRIAIAQLNYTIGAFENNKLKIMDAVQRAKATAPTWWCSLNSR